MSNASLSTADRPWRRNWPAIGAACLLINGCASVVHHAPMPGRGTTMQSVEVISEPTGVRVVLGGDVLGITPTRVLLERKNSNQVLRFEKEGYVSIDVPLARTINAAIAGNVPFALL